MTIRDVLISHLRTHDSDRVREERGTGEKKLRDKPAPERTDTVELSEEGQALASHAGLEGLSTERLEEISRRIDDGTYDTEEVAEEVARRLLKSGDLGLRPS